tara:strand:+ start:615 stop:1496 length:882 start_codon:yes stop_codon:yes gene_type:complete
MKVSVLMGGASAEREVSIKTGSAVIKACKQLGYTATPIEFYDDYKSVLSEIKFSDIVFNALHGTTGEDGTIQSWLEKYNISYTGSNSDASRICMNKDQSKKIVRENNFLTPDWFLIDKNIELSNIKFPCIVKPNAQGSTFGLSMVENKDDLERAISLASEYDRNILIENYITGREITVGILDGEPLPIVEIVPEHPIYDYECKYSPGMSKYLCPANINKSLTEKIKRDSVKIFEILGCSGYGRLDFILDNGEYHFLELNTLPGMTSTSLLPIAAKNSGYSFTQLISKIIEVSI